MRTGKDYLASLVDGRTIYVDGERVADVTAHPGFSGIAQTCARLYDHAADPDNRMIYTAPETGREANKVFMIPRSIEDLADRRAAITDWSRLTHGFVGRSPDHVGGFLAGFASNPTVFDTPDRAFGERVSSYYRRLLDESFFVSYVIIPPQVDRSSTAKDWDASYIQVGVVEERDDGIVVRGSQMLGTSSAVCDHVFVSCIKPLQEGDEDYALSLVVPAAADGLKMYCRRPYAVGHPSSFDYPLSTRFDETDALLVFDDVFVPWEDVFVCRDVQRVRQQFFDTPAHVLGNTQAQIRLVEKLKFIIGIGRKIASTNAIDRLPPVQEKLGDLASIAALVESSMLAAEAQATINDQGVAVPDPRFLYASMGLQAELYPRVLSLVRELAGAGVIQLPSSYHELVNDETRGDIERYVRSPGVGAEDRVKLFRLAWDVVGSEFGGRHHQYEMFYAGAPFVSKGYAFRNYRYEEAVERVDEFLASYDLQTEMP